jgi:serine/threonine-protein kinase
MNTWKYSISPLFGEIALNLGLCQPSHVVDALCLQEEQRGYGLSPERIGQILIERGHLKPEQVRRIMEEVENRTRTLELPGYSSLEFVSRDSTTQLFRGVELGTRRTVAIKILRFALAEAEDQHLRFREDCRRLSILNHKNVVRLRQAGDLEGIPFMVLDYVLGPDLRSHIEEHGPMPEARALDCVVQVASGIQHAHQHGVVHGALRPEAILLPRQGGAKITDFGFSDARVTGDGGGFHGLTTPYYTAPEQFRSGSRPASRSDLYSLGAIYFLMLTGRPPFRGTGQEVVRQHLKKDPPDPRVLVPGTSRASAQFCAHLMEKVPERRPESASLVISEARRILSDLTGEQGTDRSAPVGGPIGRLMSRRQSSD